MTALGRLSTVIAHEIRNPLMIIKAALRTLRRDGISANAAAALSDIDEEVVRLNGLVNGVLDFARPIRFTLAPTSLSALCAEAAAASETGVPGPPCDVRLDAEADAVVTDGPRLRQALINVLTNARQAAASRPDAAEEEAASRAMGVQLVTEAHQDDRVRVTVRDSGPGVDADTLTRLFDPFFTTKPTGTGIGLTITRHIIEGLGGTIRADARPGAGLEVLIELPRRSASAPAGTP
jgi:signal transduction histidine kinase